MMEELLVQLRNILSRSDSKTISIIAGSELAYKQRESFGDILIGLNKAQLRYDRQFTINLCNNRETEEQIKKRFPNAAVFRYSNPKDESSFMDDMISFKPGFYRSGLLTILTILNSLLDVKYNAQFVGFEFNSSNDYDKQFFDVQRKQLKQLEFTGHHVSKRYTLGDLFTNSHLVYDTDLGNSVIKNSALYHQLLSEINDQSSRTLVVAELTNNHHGDTDKLLSMIEFARDAGADMIKLQKRDINSIYTDEKLDSYYHSPFGNKFRDFRKGVELSNEQIEIAIKHSVSHNMPCFFSVLDSASYEKIRAFKMPLIKLPSTISNNRDYIHSVISSNESADLVVSTGFTDQSYEEWLLKQISNSIRNTFLMHTVSAYPTPDCDCNVSVVRHYNDLSKTLTSKIFPAYSSHDAGSLGSMLAVASGARMVEKHVKLEDADWIQFDSVALSLTSQDFHNYVNDIRQAERLCGRPQKRILESENHKY